ncbi:MAG: BatD family protein, partial [Thiobacillus sp.]|nr:BatD family protein [Thiobacillus sp.]
MVRLIIAWALLACSAAHAAALTARLDKPAVALGEAVTLTLQSRAADLDKLDTAPLDAAFDVTSRTGSQDAAGDTLVLTLYPRRAGTLRVPAFSVEGRRSPVLPLTVTDGSATVPRVTAHWTLAPALPRVNEPARLTLSLCDDGSLQWQRPDLPTHAGRIVRAL